ncbi:MAG: tryptophan--tRNA ligase [Candidatus Micrarchaeota archaeon]|nr:tryptophan--tRNA ligase [Candidatus Micrarchaeota archaeon]
MDKRFHVDPYKVEGSVDYGQFARSYGIKPIDAELRKRLEKYAGQLHFLIRRQIFYSHRDLNWLLDEYEKGNRFYVYTGRAPSEQMTIGHLLPFTMAKWLQDSFKADVYIQIPDEEKFLAKDNLKLSLDEIHGIAIENIYDIIALGFDPKHTKIFLDTEYAGKLYRNAVRVARHITFSMTKDAFGFTNESNIGKIFYTSMQAVPSFLKSVEEGHNIPCLIPLAIDQDVHFRIARDVVEKLGYYKPAIMHTKFLPSLSGDPKMSSSDPMNAIYLNDTDETVKRKIARAFTGQQATAELQRKYGGDPDKCVVCQYYKYFFEPDDKKLERILESERKGTILAGEHKQHLADRINDFLGKHRKRRERAKKMLDSFIARD